MCNQTPALSLPSYVTSNLSLGHLEPVCFPLWHNKFSNLIRYGLLTETVYACWSE